MCNKEEVCYGPRMGGNKMRMGLVVALKIVKMPLITSHHCNKT